jgi:hypothetical protein
VVAHRVELNAVGVDHAPPANDLVDRAGRRIEAEHAPGGPVEHRRPAVRAVSVLICPRDSSLLSEPEVTKSSRNDA